MKKIWIISLFISILNEMQNTVNAQLNLVPNSSFEDTLACPSGAAQLNVATGWVNPTLASPDYFNSCNGGSYGVPTNIYGHENAHFGIAYAATHHPAGSFSPAGFES